jgi:hypothetical protein
MTRRFSSRELSFLRNKIPVERVIVSFLSLQHRRDSSKLRFACPLCGGFDTSIQARTNLARCFSCKRNFNPIEIVMAHLNLGFAESADWLKDRDAGSVIETPVASEKARSSPSSIGGILSGMFLPPCPASPETTPAIILERLAVLEIKIEKLLTLIEKLAASPHR